MSEGQPEKNTGTRKRISMHMRSDRKKRRKKRLAKQHKPIHENEILKWNDNARQIDRDESHATIEKKRKRFDNNIEDAQHIQK